MRTLRIIGALLAGGVLALILAAWQVPHMLDWGRYRGEIAAIASARLGRPVSIDGNIRLRLLPDVVLTASRVTLADRGDGISASIGALRLQVALAPLLHGRILPRALALDQPTLRLPWPLPPDVAAPSSARVPKGFSATLEGGTLHVGSVVLTGLSARLRADADTGSFGATGVLTQTGQAWRFTALLGAPGADGISAFNLTVDGQDRAQGTGGFFRGRMLPSGAVDGVASAGGPDLSRLMAAPATAWHANGHVGASGLQIQAPSLDIAIGHSPGHAALALRLDDPIGLQGSLSLGQVDVADWVAALAAAPQATLPLHLDLSIMAGHLLSGIVRDLHGVLSRNGAAATLEQGSATLPGGAVLHLQGGFGSDFSGTFSLAAPDPRATLRWLHPLAPGPIDALPPGVLTQATLSGPVRASADGVSLPALSGVLDGAALSAHAELVRGPDRHATIALSLDHIDMDRWAPAAASVSGGAILETDLRIDAKLAAWHGATLTGMTLDAHAGAGGLLLRGFGFDAGGGHVAASGTVGADGTLADNKLSVTAPEAARLLPLLPPAWRFFPGLWQGGVDLAITAAGKPDAIATQLRADMGDLRLESDGTLAINPARLDATITLRHPGAPRLLHMLGIENAADWIDTGSVALAAHLHAQPGHVDVHDVALSAAALRLRGRLTADVTGDHPALEATLHADTLTLPEPPLRGPLPLAWLAGWNGALLLDADSVLLGLRPAVTDLHAVFTLADGMMAAANVTARRDTASFAGDMAVDVAAQPPRFALLAEAHGIEVGSGLSGLPADLAAGHVDLRADLLAEGSSWPALRASGTGTLHGRLTDATVSNIDLATLTRKLIPHAGKLRRALQAALASGTTAGLSGDVAATLDHGTAAIGATSVSNADGSIDLSGDIGLVDQTADLRITVRPAVPAPPSLGLRLVGPWASARRVSDVSPGLLWAGRGHPAAKQ